MQAQGWFALVLLLLASAGILLRRRVRTA